MAVLSGSWHQRSVHPGGHCTLLGGMWSTEWEAEPTPRGDVGCHKGKTTCGQKGRGQIGTDTYCLKELLCLWLTVLGFSMAGLANPQPLLSKSLQLMGMLWKRTVCLHLLKDSALWSECLCPPKSYVGT